MKTRKELEKILKNADFSCRPNSVVDEIMEDLDQDERVEFARVMGCEIGRLRGNQKRAAKAEFGDRREHIQGYFNFEEEINEAKAAAAVCYEKDEETGDITVNGIVYTAERINQLQEEEKQVIRREKQLKELLTMLGVRKPKKERKHVETFSKIQSRGTTEVVEHPYEGEIPRCPDCDHVMSVRKWNTVSYLEFVPGHYVQHDYFIPYFSCPNQCVTEDDKEILERGELPCDRLFDKSIATPSVVGDIVISLISGRNTFSNQGRMHEVNGEPVSKQDANKWFIEGAEMVESLVDEMKDDMKQCHVVLSDESPHIIREYQGEPVDLDKQKEKAAKKAQRELEKAQKKKDSKNNKPSKRIDAMMMDEDDDELETDMTSVTDKNNQNTQEAGEKKTDKEVKKRKHSWMYALMTGIHEPNQMTIYVGSKTRQKYAVESTLGKEFKGVMMSDGAALYNQLVCELANCNTHARRELGEAIEEREDFAKFKKVKGTEPILDFLRDHDVLRELLYALTLYSEVYRLEKIAGQEKEPEMILRSRQLNVKPVFMKLKKQMEYIRDNFEEKSKGHGAACYFLNRVEKLGYFLEDGEVPICNNRCEALGIRGFVWIRQNILFSNTKRGCDALCTWMTLVRSAQMNGLNPYRYVVHVLTTLRDKGYDRETVRSLLPYSDSLPEYLKAGYVEHRNSLAGTKERMGPGAHIQPAAGSRLAA